LRRIYVSEEAYRRLKLRCLNRRCGMRELADAIVLSALDERGEFARGPSFSPDLVERLRGWSGQLGITEEELVWRMLRTVSVLYDERVKLADVLNIPRLERLVAEREAGS